MAQSFVDVHHGLERRTSAARVHSTRQAEPTGKFHGRLRDENANYFLTLKDAPQKIESWRRDYNQQGPQFLELFAASRIRADAAEMQS